MRSLLNKIRDQLAQVPLLGWLFGALVAVAVEYLVGDLLAVALGMPGMPALFGLEIMFKQPLLIPSAILYVLLVYLLPAVAVAWLSSSLVNKLAARLLTFPLGISVIVHLGLLYAVLHMWGSLSDYRLLVLRLTLIAIMLTLSLNVVNGYMGEFSCSHPGFMALGAYASSVFTVIAFVHDDVFGPPVLPPALGPFMFPLALIVGGLVAALAALLVAIPSFRTRGDYLAIISLAFMFIVKSLIENLEIVGGPRGFMNQPPWGNLPTVFVWTVICVAVIHNFVSSTLGKAMCAIRDDEIAAEALTVNTRRTKIVAFLFAAFWAGVAGGLFAHVMGYINPGTFGVLKLCEVLAMVYLGGLNSVVGSIAGAVGLQLLMEALRPLQILKWIVIPTLLILIMVFRPTGLIAFREMNIERLLKPRQKAVKEVKYAIASD
jgi:branched-chain amino acid transport system permease protein